MTPTYREANKTKDTGTMWTNTQQMQKFQVKLCTTLGQPVKHLEPKYNEAAGLNCLSNLGILVQ